MNRAGRMAAGVMVALGALVALGGTSGTLFAATPTNPPTTPPPAPAPTTAAPPQTPAPTPAPTTTTIPYKTVVEQDCAEYSGDTKLADQLDKLKGKDGSAHLVLLARFCGVQFSDKAEADPDLDRPWSNLEYAVRDQDDPFFTNTYDAVTANKAQADLVQEVSTEAWYAAHPELVPKTTAPPTTLPPTTTTTVATSVVVDTSDVSDTTEPDDGPDDSGTDDPSQTGNPFWQIVGVLILGVGAAIWGVSGVRTDGE